MDKPNADHVNADGPSTLDQTASIKSDASDETMMPTTNVVSRDDEESQDNPQTTVKPCDSEEPEETQSSPNTQAQVEINVHHFDEENLRQIVDEQQVQIKEQNERINEMLDFQSQMRQQLCKLSEFNHKMSLALTADNRSRNIQQDTEEREWEDKASEEMRAIVQKSRLEADERNRNHDAGKFTGGIKTPSPEIGIIGARQPNFEIIGSNPNIEQSEPEHAISYGKEQGFNLLTNANLRLHESITEAEKSSEELISDDPFVYLP